MFQFRIKLETCYKKTMQKMSLNKINFTLYVKIVCYNISKCYCIFILSFSNIPTNLFCIYLHLHYRKFIADMQEWGVYKHECIGCMNECSCAFRMDTNLCRNLMLVYKKNIEYWNKHQFNNFCVSDTLTCKKKYN